MIEHLGDRRRLISVLCEFKDSLIYTVSSRTARDRERPYLQTKHVLLKLKKQQQQKKNKHETQQLLRNETGGIRADIPYTHYTADICPQTLKPSRTLPDFSLKYLVFS